MNLLMDLQDSLNLTYLFISHDLVLSERISHSVSVMYQGEIVEFADSQELYQSPKHPYTQALHSAVPLPDPVRESIRERVILEGDIPSPSNPPPGCPFHTRCPVAEERCSVEVPEWRESTAGHWVACHLAP